MLPLANGRSLKSCKAVIIQIITKLLNIVSQSFADSKKTTAPCSIVAPSVIRLEPNNIVVTKLFSKYCNTALSVVHKLHTAPFQCSSPLFPLGFTKVYNYIDN